MPVVTLLDHIGREAALTKEAQLDAGDLERGQSERVVVRRWAFVRVEDSVSERSRTTLSDLDQNEQSEQSSTSDVRLGALFTLEAKFFPRHGFFVSCLKDDFFEPLKGLKDDNFIAGTLHLGKSLDS